MRYMATVTKKKKKKAEHEAKENPIESTELHPSLPALMRTSHTAQSKGVHAMDTKEDSISFFS